MARAMEQKHIQRAYRFALQPNVVQEQKFHSHVGGARFVYNWGIDQVINALDARKAQRDAGQTPDVKIPDHFDLCKMWTEHKNSQPEELHWVSENFVGTYQASLRDSRVAWKNFFDSRSGRRAGRPVNRPRFKSKSKSRASFQMHGDGLKLIDQSHIQFPKIGIVKIPGKIRIGTYTDRNARISRSLMRQLRKGDTDCPQCRGSGQIVKPGRVLKDGSVKPDIMAKCSVCHGNGRAPVCRIVRATITRGASGVWWCSVTTSEVRAIPIGPSKRQLANGAVGLDLGTRFLAVDSDGSMHENPRHLEQALNDLKLAQRVLSRTKKDSKRREKARKRVGVIHERVALLRRDSTNKLSTKLAKTFSCVAVEGWDAQALASKKDDKLPKKIQRRRNRQLADAAPGMLRWQLEYKTSWYGSSFAKTEPHQGTGRTCSSCAVVRAKPVRIDAELFVCDACGASIDRRVNTARVVRNEATGQPPRLGVRSAPVEPRGGGVRPETVRSGRRPSSKRVAGTRSRDLGKTGTPGP